MLEGAIKMIDEKEIKTLAKYQFWKMIIYQKEDIEKKETHRSYSGCNGCNMCHSCGAGSCGGCQGCSICSA